LTTAAIYFDKEHETDLSSIETQKGSEIWFSGAHEDVRREEGFVASASERAR
jgi:hypothetical protein